MRKDAIEGTSGSVSSEEELRAALARGLTPITLTGCFSINGADSLVVDYNAEIIGGGHILTRGDRFTRILFTVTDGGSLTLRDVVVDGSRDTAGRTNSLIRLNGGTLRLEEWTVLQNNFANGEGGGVYLNGGAATENHLFLTENAVIRHCEAGTAGGGIYASFRNPDVPSTLHLGGCCLITGNRAVLGGGVAVRHLPAGPGASPGAGELTLEGCVLLTDNTSTGAGGGLAYLNDAGDSGYQSPVPIRLVLGGETQITDNHAADNGGGVYVLSTHPADSVVVRDSALLTGNTANMGGGLFLDCANGAAELTLDGGEISGNTAAGNGGGIHYQIVRKPGAPDDPEASGVIRLTGTSVMNNTALSGGGLSFNNAVPSSRVSVILRMEEGRVSENRAAGSGGGLYRQGRGAFTMELLGGEISGNIAEGSYGGGVYFYSPADANHLIVEAPVAITGNCAARYGGGIYYYPAGGGRMRMTGGDVSGNCAGNNGGGLFCTATQGAGTVFAISGGTIQDNRAEVGGGLYAAYGRLELTGGFIDGNTASEGGGIAANGTAEGSRMRGGRLTENTAQTGGGLLLADAGQFALLGGEVSANQARDGGGAAIARGGTLFMTEGAAISGNTAEQAGGGVYNSGGTLHMEGSATVTANMARTGGGIANVGSEESALTAILGLAAVTENRSQASGGGLYNAGAAAVVRLAGQAAVARNRSQGDGGGVCNRQGGTLTLAQEAAVTGNAANGKGAGVFNSAFLTAEEQPDAANGLYLPDEDAAPVIRGPLGARAALQIVRSPYVAPSPDGVPIVLAIADPVRYPRLTAADAAAFIKPPEGFDGWDIRLEAGGTQVMLAPRPYRIRYENLLGASHTNPVSYTAYSPDIVLADPVLAGFRFLGWYDAPQDGEQVPRIPQGSQGDCTLYARWERLSYTVTYEGNAAGRPPVLCLPPAQIVFCGDTAAISEQLPRRRRFRFVGWSANPEGTGTLYRPGQPLPDRQNDLVLYAVWISCRRCR